MGANVKEKSNRRAQNSDFLFIYCFLGGGGQKVLTGEF